MLQGNIGHGLSGALYDDAQAILQNVALKKYQTSALVDMTKCWTRESININKN